MNKATLLGLLMLLLQAPLADPALAQADAVACAQAIAPAERSARLPPRLLHSIALVESGRRDARTGAVAPWPWTINAEGAGFFYDSREQAIAAAQAFLARGIRSIDVGCMQINLLHHPTAFASLEQAFDPATNVAYAARLLRELFAATSTWPDAAGAYHSQTAELKADYQRKVMAVWPLAGRYGDIPAPMARRPANEVDRLLAQQAGERERLLARMRGPGLLEALAGRSSRLRPRVLARAGGAALRS